MPDSAHAVSHQRYTSGIQVLWSESADTQLLCKSVASSSEQEAISLAIVWFSPTTHSADEITGTLLKIAPELSFCGCSTSGEVTPFGMQEHGFIAVLLPQRWFITKTVVLNDVSNLGMETIAEYISNSRQAFSQQLSASFNNKDLFAINLIDGLSYSEETVTLAIDRGLDGIPLIGGSAGDDLQFQTTWQICNEGAFTGAAVLVLIHCSLPFEIFTNNNFVPTDHKFVVTQADPDLRRVSELNAEPASVAYANAIGMEERHLDAGSFASYSVIVRFGEKYYCRSIQQLNDDQSFTFFCAIDNGLVLTLARSEGMVASTRQAIEEIEQQIGPIDVLFGFDCIYRKLDAQYRQTTHRISALYKEKNFIGFNTYGEQYNSMHINQTFTGVAIGMPD